MIMEEKKVLREELKDEELNEVAGGKKFKKSDYKEAEKKRKEAEERAKKLMGQKRSF